MTVTAQDIAEMRDWIADCEWTDITDVAALPDAAVLRGIERHYANGIAGFLADGA